MNSWRIQGGVTLQKNLRQRSIGQLLDSIYHQYRRYFPPLFIVSLFFELPQLILGALVQSHANQPVNWQLLNQGQAGVQQFFAQIESSASVHGGLLVAILGIIVTMLNLNVFTPLLNGSYYSMTQLALSKDANHPLPKVRTGFLIHQAKTRWLAFLSTLWLLVGLSVAGIIVLGLIAFGLALVGGLQLALVILYLAALVAIMWIVTRLSFTFVVVVIEKKSNWSAIKRSWQLTSNRFWFVFIMLAICQVVISFATMGFTSLVSFLPGAWLQTFLGWMFAIVIQPLYALVLVNLFWDMRSSQEI